MNIVGEVKKQKTKYEQYMDIYIYMDVAARIYM